MSNTKVIAISGASGSGKTTIVKRLAQEFNCPYLLFDQYTDADTYPTDMKSWFEQGANVSLIKTPRFASAIQSSLLKRNCRYIFIEEPFGKERDSMSELIDYVVLLEQPLALCLTRIKARHAGNAVSFSLFKVKYDDHFKDIYSCTVKQVKNNSDLIINEVSSIINTSNLISSWLKRNECSNQTKQNS